MFRFYLSIIFYNKNGNPMLTFLFYPNRLILPALRMRSCGAVVDDVFSSNGNELKFEHLYRNMRHVVNPHKKNRHCELSSPRLSRGERNAGRQKVKNGARRNHVRIPRSGGFWCVFCIGSYTYGVSDCFNLSVNLFSIKRTPSPHTPVWVVITIKNFVVRNRMCRFGCLSDDYMYASIYMEYIDW